MGRRRKGPRLWLRQERRDSLGRLTHGAVWIIIDGTRQVVTGFYADQRIEAEGALLAYCEACEISAQFPELYIYFVSADVDGFPVKIGVSETPQLRMATLQTGLPYDLKVLATIRIPDTLFERRVHRKFAASRLRGEWFERTPELLDYITHLSVEQNRTANELPKPPVNL